MLLDSYVWEAALREEGFRRIAELRHEIGDAFVAADIHLLRPMCWACERGLWGVEEDDPCREPKVVPVLGQASEHILCLYDWANQHVTFLIDQDSQEPYDLACWRCGQTLEVYDGASFPAYLETFAEYFGVPEAGPVNPPPSFKRSLKAFYGWKCVACKREFEEEDLTVDHIVARAHGGDGSPLNLQVLCRTCNEEKANLPTKRVEVYLDFLLQPYPE